MNPQGDYGRRILQWTTGSSSLVSNWEEVTFHTDLAFLCSALSYSTAKLKEEEEEEEGWPVPLASELLWVGLSSPICPVWSHLSLVSAQAGKRAWAPLWAYMSISDHPSLCQRCHAWAWPPQHLHNQHAHTRISRITCSHVHTPMFLWLKLKLQPLKHTQSNKNT